MSDKTINIPAGRESAAVRAANRSIEQMKQLVISAERTRNRKLATACRRSLIRMHEVRRRLLAEIDREATAFVPADSLDQESCDRTGVDVIPSTCDTDARRYFEVFDRSLAGAPTRRAS